jgi:hypothetical protein
VIPHQHTAYGSFHGGDPRSFHPDGECSSDEEREAHRAACARWDQAAREGRSVVEEAGDFDDADQMYVDGGP